MIALTRRACSVCAIAAFVCAVPLSARSQGSGVVGGTVTDVLGRPIRGISVLVLNDAVLAVTDSLGRYTIPHVPAGPQRLLFHGSGFATREVYVSVANAASVTVDIVLDQQPVALGAVVVQGVSAAADRMIDAPAAVDVVPPARLERLSITGQPALVLASVPGLDVVQAGLRDFDVNARGFNTALPRKMLVMQDGRDLADNNGSEFWGAMSQPLEDIQRIEVIRGPVSPLYGANAYNGVISITTPSARDVIGTKVTIGGGDLGTVRGDLRHAGVLLHERVGYKVNLGYDRSRDWARSRTARDASDWKREYAPTGIVPNTPAPETIPLFGQTRDSVTGAALGTPAPLVSTYGSARVDFYADDRSTIALEGGNAVIDNLILLNGNGRYQARRTVRPWARVAWNTDAGGISAWYNGLSFSSIGLARGAPLADAENIVHLDGHATRTFLGEAGRVLLGASVEESQVNTKGTALGTGDDHRGRKYGAFGELEYGASRLRFISALRWDASDLFPNQLSPRIGVVVSPSPNQAVRLTVSQGFLTPALINLFGSRAAYAGSVDLSAIEAKLRADPNVGPALAGVPNGKLFDNSLAVPESSYGNRYLRPQKLMSYEAGYRAQVGSRIFASIDAYRVHIHDLTTNLLPAAQLGLNRTFRPWTAPDAVPASARDAVQSAARQALLDAGKTDPANGLTRLPNGNTAVAFSYGNIGAADEWGLELSSVVSLSATLSLSTSYTWYDFAIRQNLASNVLSANTPNRKGTAALEYSGRQGIDLSVDARMVGGYRWSGGVWTGYIPPTQTVDLTGARRMNAHLRMFASVTDLLDQRRFQLYGGSVVGRRALAGLTSSF